MNASARLVATVGCFFMKNAGLHNAGLHTKTDCGLRQQISEKPAPAPSEKNTKLSQNVVTTTYFFSHP
jgi:hypothetical protein